MSGLAPALESWRKRRDSRRRLRVESSTPSGANFGNLSSPSRREWHRDTLLAFLVALEMLACWPVWPWLWTRFSTAPEEWGSLGALAAAAYFSCRERGVSALSLRTPALFLIAYAAGYAWVPAIASAALALVSVGSTLRAGRRSGAPPAALTGLWLLGTPLAASLEFMLGFPLRWMSAQLSAAWLRASGWMVMAQGTLLEAGPHLVEVDAPCSGVRMLWTGWLLALILCCFSRLPAGRTAAALAGATGVVLIANVLRATALFCLEAGGRQWPSFAHGGTGIAAFLGAAFAIMFWISRLQSPRPCEAH